jgi:peroxin-5
MFKAFLSLVSSMLTTENIRPMLHPELPRFRPEAEHVITQADFPPEQIHQQESYSEPTDADELSRTAGLLVDAVKEETNPKFQNSAFLGLMRQLRDKELVVEGAQVVRAQASSTLPSTWAQDFTAAPDVKGKGKARADIIPELMDGTYAAAGSSFSVSRKSVHFGPPEVFADDPEKIEDPDDRYWRQENKEYQNYWSSVDHAETQQVVPAPDWEGLQDDWDRFEATATGIKPVSVYQFQLNNPYLVGDSSTTRNHSMHTQRFSSDEVSPIAVYNAVW